MLREALRIGSRRSYSYKSVRRPNLNVAAVSKANSVKPKQEQSNTLEDAAGHGISRGNLTKQLTAKMLATGPITVAEYMREVLTNPQSGYYMHRDVFGREGDFITSPEISQIFGELVGIWLLAEWQKLGSPSPFQLVELGPGRGTLARDVLKVLTKFKAGADFTMHMVEISPYLSQAQAQRFCYKHETVPEEAQLPHYQVGTTATGVQAFWHRHLEDVPPGFSLVLAHEFFDALPVHKLQLVNGQWLEVLIDVPRTQETETKNADFSYVLPKSQTPVSRLFKPVPQETRSCLEYSLETERHVGLLADRLERQGGIALIMDYGHLGDKTDTFRAFKQHALHEPLLAPGTADLTADVDFRHIKHVVETHNQVHCCGPVQQGDFLSRMQGELRLEQLLANALPENQDIIRSGYKMLTDANQMGSRYKFLAMFPGVMAEHLKKYPVAGFS
ncbi:protein arginine methyltransferase NDUFAF7 homolog, mitochondrial [Drosophila grimshawi]|uniref:Protein arginine methyltransferase NDUFAF7 n=1 Tax=Drosophila grimshawi TaxID=7222 RepID=B4JUV4_DROGR|nr:protein arginine methyltransferase NDUFAF7 homolog, mitochondrial [Drosophila grimshawi]EDV91274.1 GH14945 [Drosophila grimshawi]